MITKNMPMEHYLALPAVSAGLILRLLDECPKAAWHESWLNPRRAADESDAADIGTIAHSILLEGNSGNVAVIDPADHPAERTGAIPDGWTNKSIRQARDNARADGRIPILVGDMDRVQAMVEAARDYIDSLRETEPAVWACMAARGGDSELTITWKHSGAGFSTDCRARPDRISTDRSIVVHVKTTERSAEPDRWGRTHLIGLGEYVRAAFYREAIVRECGGVQSEHVFLVIEQHPPYLCSLVGVDPHGYALGRDKVMTGLELWARCAAVQKWPGYPNRACYPTIPPWIDAHWEERQMGNAYDYETMFGQGKP